MKKKMLMKSFEIVLKIIPENHVFRFNKKLYKQKKGGAIGVSLAGDIANLFMVWWDRELKKRLTYHNCYLKLYARYVDDGNIAIKKLTNAAGADTSDEETTMEKVEEIANKSIVVKVDYPSNHENNRLPVLDMEFWIAQVEVNGELNHQILYSHYMKPVSSRYVIHKDSAISYNTKLNILTNKLTRVMRNISPHVTAEEKQQHIQYFMHRLQFSGYNKEERIKVYKKSRIKFQERQHNEISGSTDERERTKTERIVQERRI